MRDLEELLIIPAKNHHQDTIELPVKKPAEAGLITALRASLIFSTRLS